MHVAALPDAQKHNKADKERERESSSTAQHKRFPRGLVGFFCPLSCAHAAQLQLQTVVEEASDLKAEDRMPQILRQIIMWYCACAVRVVFVLHLVFPFATAAALERSMFP